MIEKNMMVPVDELFAGKPVMIYPREVPEHLDPYELIALAAELVGRDPKFDHVLQFLFVVEGGRFTKLLQIAEHNSSVTELAGDAREWPFFKEAGAAVN